MEGFEGRSPRVATAENNTQSATQPHHNVRMPHTATELMIYGRRPGSFSRATDEIRFTRAVRKNEKRQILNLSFCLQSACLAEREVTELQSAII